MAKERGKTEIEQNQADRKIVVGIGEVVWDLFPDGAYMGGAPANFVYYCQLLGQEGILISRVGEDELGRETCRRFSSHGLKTDFIQVDKIHPTGTVKVELNPEKIPTFTIEENVAWDFLEKNDVLSTLAAKASAICFGSLASRSAISRETINWFLEQAGPGCLRVLDINLRPPFFTAELLDRLLGKADVLKLNEAELQTIGELFYPGLKEELLLCQRLLSDYRLRLIALTKGEKGSLLITPSEQSYHPAFTTEVVDTVGAGDAFTAALVTGLLQNERLDDINRQANWVASRVCAQKGAWVRL